MNYKFSEIFYYKQYVVVRKDLPKVHQTIQAAHAAALAGELTYKYERYPPGPRERHLIILEVSNKFKLRLIFWYLKYIRRISVVGYYEEYKPVSKWGLTAISCYAKITRNSDTETETGNPLSFLNLWSCDT